MKHRNWLVRLALVGVLALVAAACQQAADTDGEVTDPRGVIDIAADDPIKIATAQAISGDNASLGTDQVRAIEIAIADKGQLLGHDIELQVEDDLCDSSGGTAAGQKVAADPQVVGVLGTSCSGAAVPMAPLLDDAGIVMISGSNTSPFLTQAPFGTEAEDHQPNYFRTAHNDLIQGAAAATFAFEECGVTKAASIHDGDPYTSGLAGAFDDAFQGLGGEMVLQTAVSPDDTDMRPVLTEVAAAEAELVFFPIFQPAGDFIAKQAREIEGLQSTVLMGADGLLSDTYIVIPETKQSPGCPGIDGAPDGMYHSGPATPTGGEYEEFVAKYEAANGEKPIQAFNGHAYDAANVLFAAIEEVAVQADDGSLQIGRQALIDAVAATDGFQGLTGTISCDEFGDCADPKIDILQNTKDQKDITAVKANVLASFTRGDLGI
ncbi:MAG TPA: branched-chain amino acid ABC transporter substrate-binding protein [Actinomycetota bacterium]|jgi:branched-chain amino acid transport system substrate-binding protein|nr:branched-chain amino acid ABC transporter substrate-binding protein [Actinomycetota bacterium]